MPWAIDLDGVMWLGDEPIEGSADAVRRLREAGEPVLFVTNNSSVPRRQVEAKLARHGVEAAEVLTSAMAAATLVDPGCVAMVLGGPGIVDALGARGVTTVEPVPSSAGPPDVVVVGFTREVDYDRLSVASTAVRSGAVLIGTNTDPTYPTPDGEIPGGGAILAAVATASGREPLVAGKPYEPLARLVRERLGSDGTMAGDRPDTDGAFAGRLGYRFVLVRSGVEVDMDRAEPGPDLVAGNLAEAVDVALAM